MALWTIRRFTTNNLDPSVTATPFCFAVILEDLSAPGTFDARQYCVADITVRDDVTASLAQLTSDYADNDWD